MPIPGDLESITSGWLAEALNAPVTGHRVVDAHAGTTGRAVIEMQYGAATDLPDRLFVKLPPTDELQRAFVTSSGMGRREALFYGKLAAEVPVRVPRGYFSDCDDSGEQYIMLMEHLEDSGCSFQNASNHYSLDYVRSVLDAFAKLHARYWETPRFDDDLGWLQPPMQHDIAVGLIGSALDQHAANMPAVFTAMGELYLEETDAVHRLWNFGPHTVIHGDVHDANLFLDGGEPGFLDWALVGRGPAMRDVGYFLAGTLEAGDRWALRELLEYYRERLEFHGARAPSREDLWHQCQWHAAYVWVGAAVTLAMGDAWQPVNYVLSSLERLHGAMEEMGSVGAIRAAL